MASTCPIRPYRGVVLDGFRIKNAVGQRDSSGWPAHRCPAQGGLPWASSRFNALCARAGNLDCWQVAECLLRFNDLPAGGPGGLPPLLRHSIFAAEDLGPGGGANLKIQVSA